METLDPNRPPRNRQAGREWICSTLEALTRAELDTHLETLLHLEAADSPCLSCYLTIPENHAHSSRVIQRRLRAMQETLSQPDHRALQAALEPVRSFLGRDLKPMTRGAAIFSRAGDRSYFLGLQFQVPVRTGLFFEPTPIIEPLVELHDTHHRYIVVMATQASLRILETSLGSLTADLWTVGPRDSDPAGQTNWLPETIQKIDEIIHSARHTHLILAGDPALTGRLAAGLPPRLRQKLVGTVPAEARNTVWEVLSPVRSTFIQRERQESLAAVDNLAAALQSGRGAAAGTTGTLQALREGKAMLLVMAKAYADLSGWRCAACGCLGEGPAPPLRCPECAAGRPAKANLKEEMVKQALRTGAEVEFVGRSDALLQLGGVGCLLRPSGRSLPPPPPP